MRQNLAQFSAGSAAVIATLFAVHGLGGQTSAQAESFDSRWTAVEPVQKGDRLGTLTTERGSSVVFYSDPQVGITIATKLEFTRNESRNETRNESSRNSRNIPADNARQEEKPKKLPVGCEPSFSPVTMPSMANVTGRCLSALDNPVKVASLTP